MDKLQTPDSLGPPPAEIRRVSTEQASSNDVIAALDAHSKETYECGKAIAALIAKISKESEEKLNREHHAKEALATKLRNVEKQVDELCSRNILLERSLKLTRETLGKTERQLTVERNHTQTLSAEVSEAKAALEQVKSHLQTTTMRLRKLKSMGRVMHNKILRHVESMAYIHWLCRQARVHHGHIVKLLVQNTAVALVKEWHGIKKEYEAVTNGGTFTKRPVVDVEQQQSPEDGSHTPETEFEAGATA